MGTVVLKTVETVVQGAPEYTWDAKPTAAEFGKGSVWFTDIGATGYSDGVTWNILSGLLDIRSSGAKIDGVTDDTAALTNAVSAMLSSGKRDLFIPNTGSPMLISTASNLNLGNIRLIFESGAKIKITSTANYVFLIGDNFALQDGWEIEVATEYPMANNSPQAIFSTTAFSFTTPVNRRTGIYFGRGICNCTVSVGDGTVRGGRFFLGYAANVTLNEVSISNMRDCFFDFGTDVSGISASNCVFTNVERGFVVFGLDSELGNSIISYGFSFINNILTNTPTQQTNYHLVEGSDLYNLGNLGNVTIIGGSSSYACERAIYIIGTDNVLIDGFTSTGTTMLKATGMQYDLTSTGGIAVDHKCKNLSVLNCIVNDTQANFSSIYMNFISKFTIANCRFINTTASANSTIYIESYADTGIILGNFAKNFKRGFLNLRSFKDLPAAGNIPLRPDGKYTRGFWDINIENNSVLDVCELGADTAYTPTRAIYAIYTLEEDDLVPVLVSASKNDLYKNLVIKNNNINVFNAFAGDRVYGASANCRGLIFINYCNRVMITGNVLHKSGGNNIAGVLVGSISRDVRLTHEVGQITDYSTVPAIQSPLYITDGSVIRFVDSQLFGATNASYATYEYTLTPIMSSGAFSPTTAREQTQNAALKYRLHIRVQARIANTETIYISSPTSGATRDYLTGVLDATLSSFAHVFGRIDSDDGNWVDFYSNTPWTSVILKANSAGFATAFTLETVTTTVTKALRLTNTSGALRRVDIDQTFIVERSGVL